MLEDMDIAAAKISAIRIMPNQQRHILNTELHFIPAAW